MTHSGITARACGVALAAALVNNACSRTGLSGEWTDLAGTGATTGNGIPSGAGGGRGRRADGGNAAVTGGATGEGDSGLSDGSSSGGGAMDGARGSGGASADGGVESGARPPPLCTGMTNPVAVDIWSDARGPFLLSSDLSGTALFWHQAVWHEIYRQPPGTLGASSVGGFPGGPLVLGGPCNGAALIQIDGTIQSCSSWFLPHPFIISTTRAYGISGAARNRVGIYDGSRWTQYQTSFDIGVWRLWVNSSTVVAALESGLVAVSRNGGPWASEGVPDGSAPDPYGSAFPLAWGFGDNDIWVALRHAGLFSFDGTGWTQRATLDDSCGTGSGIRGMWGASGTLFLHTDHRLARWTNGSFGVVKELPCTSTIRAIWGTSADEVYVAVDDSERYGSACGSVTVLLVTSSGITRL